MAFGPGWFVAFAATSGNDVEALVAVDRGWARFDAVLPPELSPTGKSREILRVMTRENVTTVQLAIAAINDRDVDAYLACCVEDVELHTPVSPVEGPYRGTTGIRRFFSDIAAAGPDFRIEIERIEALGSDRVLALTRISASGRESGVDMGAETAHVWDLIDGKIKTIAVYLNRDEGRRAAGLAD
jgi:ketosteroid isomerase-like protein